MPIKEAFVFALLNRLTNSTSPALRAGMKQVRRNQSPILFPLPGSKLFLKNRNATGKPAKQTANYVFIKQMTARLFLNSFFIKSIFCCPAIVHVASPVVSLVSSRLKAGHLYVPIIY